MYIHNITPLTPSRVSKTNVPCTLSVHGLAGASAAEPSRVQVSLAGEAVGVRDAKGRRDEGERDHRHASGDLRSRRPRAEIVAKFSTFREDDQGDDRQKK